MPLFQMFTLAASPPTWETRKRWQVLIDWANTGDFSNETYGDVVPDLVGEVQCERGFEGDSQLSLRATAGTLTALLRNRDGKYSSLNASSPLYGYIKPGLLVQAWVLTPYAGSLWTGKLDSIQLLSADDSPTGEPAAQIRAVGLLRDLGDSSRLVTTALMTDAMPGEVVQALLTAGGVTEAVDIDVGSVPVGPHWKENQPLLPAIQEMEEHEFGRFYETKDGGYRFEERYARLANGVQATITDTPAGSFPSMNASMEDSLRRIYNRATATLHPYVAPTETTVLWEASTQDVHYLAPGASATYIAKYSDGYVDPWTTPVSGTDVISATGTLVVSNVSKRAQSMVFTVTNTHVSQPATLTTLQARGEAWVEGQELEVEATDDDGKRTYPLSSPYYTSREYALRSCQLVVQAQKDPHPLLTFSIPSISSDVYSEAAARLDVSDRVTVNLNELSTKFGLASADYFIERVRHSFGGGMPWITTYMLSPAFAEIYDLDIWQLGMSGHSELGDTTVTAY